MRLLAAYLFHIETLNDATSSYRKIKFLTRYPERFHEKLRLPVLILCLQQFIVNLLCECMNLIILCMLPNFNELIMNYVAFAGLLKIDNIYMLT